MNVYLLTTLTYPQKNPSPCQGLGFAEGQKKSWPLPLPFLPLPFVELGLCNLSLEFSLTHVVVAESSFG